MTFSQGFHFWLGAELARFALGLGLVAVIVVGFVLYLVAGYLITKLRRLMR